MASPEEAETRFHTRQPIYQRLAHITVATGELTPTEAGSTIIDTLLRPQGTNLTRFL